MTPLAASSTSSAETIDPTGAGVPIRADTPALATSGPWFMGPGISRLRPVLVVGLGNPLLGDDGVGWAVIDALDARLARPATPEEWPPLELDRLAGGGLTLMERLVGHSRAILVDAITTGTEPPGTVRRLRLDDLVGGPTGHLDNAHDASLARALEAGSALGADLPSDIEVVAIEATRVEEFGESLSPAVAASVSPAVAAVLAALHRGTASASPPPPGGTQRSRDGLGRDALPGRHG
jgi:hydrogenase maturation protease